MRGNSPIPGSVRVFCVRCTPIAMLCAGMLSFASSGRAQDVAEAARQEQARKAKQTAPRHVYTEDDLKRDRILTPDDRARVEARKRNSPTPPDAGQPSQTLDAGSGSASESLGEIARRYRREKAAREAEEALKRQSPAGFPMSLPATSLATPKPNVVPRSEARPRTTRRNPMFMATAPPRVASATPSPAPVNPRVLPAPRSAYAPKRISPFMPRPLLAPARPSRSLPVVNGSELQRVTVKRGDSFWKLSREYLGRGARWQELLAVNPGWSDPNRLTTGSEILVPRKTVVTVSHSNSENLITVRTGDTLWSIARSHFGRGAAWSCVARANSAVSNPDLIFPGQQLLLPASCSVAP